MVGTRIVMTPFDPNKRTHWLTADIHGMLMTWVMTLGIGFLLFVVLERSGVPVFDLCAKIRQMLAGVIGDLGAFYSMMAFTALPAFILVFSLRRNVVVGTRREIHYFCRWF